MNKPLIFRCTAFGINLLIAGLLVFSTIMVFVFSIWMGGGILEVLERTINHPIHLTLSIFAIIILLLLPISYNFHKNRQYKIIFCSAFTIMTITTVILLSI